VLVAPLLLALAAATEPAPALSLRLVATVAFAGVFGAAGGQLLFTMLLRRGEASVVSAWMFSVPITAAVLGVVLLGEPLRAPLVIGLVLVSAGVRLASKRPAPPAPAARTRGTPVAVRPSESARDRASA
jgi:drug/metabolite transporter (DMT)-like permease